MGTCKLYPTYECIAKSSYVIVPYALCWWRKLTMPTLIDKADDHNRITEGLLTWNASQEGRWWWYCRTLTIKPYWLHLLNECRKTEAWVVSFVHYGDETIIGSRRVVFYWWCSNNNLDCSLGGNYSIPLQWIQELVVRIKMTRIRVCARRSVPCIWEKKKQTIQ